MLCEHRQIAICESPHIWGVGGGGRGEEEGERGEEGGCVGEIGVSCVNMRERGDWEVYWGRIQGEDA